MITIGMNYYVIPGKEEPFEAACAKVIDTMGGIEGHDTSEIYRQLGDKDPVYLILSRWSNETAFDEFVASVHEVRAGGTGAPGDGTDPAGGPLADLCELAVLGEQVGLGLALAEGYDPAPAPGLQWRV